MLTPSTRFLPPPAKSKTRLVPTPSPMVRLLVCLQVDTHLAVRAKCLPRLARCELWGCGAGRQLSRPCANVALLQAMLAVPDHHACMLSMRAGCLQAGLLDCMPVAAGLPSAPHMQHTRLPPCVSASNVAAAPAAPLPHTHAICSITPYFSS